MTSDILHDALTLLPEDLVAETALARSRTRVIPWKRWAAMAACLAVVLWGSLLAMDLFMPKSASDAAAQFSLESAYGGAMAKADAPAQEARRTEEDSGAGDAPMADADLPPHAAAANTVLSPWKNQATLSYFPQGGSEDGADSQVRLIQSREALTDLIGEYSGFYDLTGLDAQLQSYDEAWFTENELLFVRLPQGIWQPESLTAQEGYWSLTLKAEDAADSQGEQWLFLDLTPGIITQASDVTVTFAP